MTDIIVQQGRNTFNDLSHAISQTPTIDDTHEIRARIEALKAWAKVHKLTKKLRLDLLRVEMDALLRIIELGGADTLSRPEQEAAEWLAAKTPTERQHILTASGAATTVTGMCRSIWREDEILRNQEAAHRGGIEYATEPTPPPAWDQEAVEQERRRYYSIAAGMAELIDTYTNQGVPFTIADMADEIIYDAGDPYSELDPEFYEGVREVCRTALRKEPPLTIEGTVIPRFITTRLEDGDYARIPVKNALIEHLQDMVMMRKEQLAQDSAALDRLEKFRDRLLGITGAHEGSRIGELLAQTMTD